MNKKLNFVLCWHMHQPYYRKGLKGSFALPWVYLHAIKDYDDMAAHLEQNPNMKVVINFVPTLLEQLDHYAETMRSFLHQGKKMPDPLLNYLAGVLPIPNDLSGRQNLIKKCERAYRQFMIEPYEHYRYLLDFGLNPEHQNLLPYLDEQYFIDLLVWYHLAWCSHHLKQMELVQALMQKQKNFDVDDRLQLISLFQQTIASIIPRYKKLAEKGQIELSMTPWGHPIIPLLNDFHNMDEVQPHDPRPEASHYPNGLERSRWHLEHGFKVFEYYFGQRPKGIWLAEGGISDDAVALLDEYEIEWTASGQKVWQHSCINNQLCENHHKICHSAAFQPYHLKDYQPLIYFRDDGLSDLIGFTYQKWHPQDAVTDFIQNLHNIASNLGDEVDQHVVSVILDGENAWEYYPNNGHDFLSQLYQRLSQDERLQISTFQELNGRVKQGQLDHIVAGSWVFGSFSTWIGSTDKNKAWDLLVQLKQAFDRLFTQLKPEKQQEALRLLGICEASDWFWWFGDYNNADSVRDFEQLYRQQLKILYCTLGISYPDKLNQVISIGNAHSQVENSGTMRKN